MQINDLVGKTIKFIKLPKQYSGDRIQIVFEDDTLFIIDASGFDSSLNYVINPKTCYDCIQRIGEECGIDGREIYHDNEICSSFDES